ncbi:paired amphipathic helix protein Sin3-like 2 [Gossypium hirsutum]|uniref:Paired amphipathic helix protein Sin3-like 2 n=1 Tax=Gossypium hirsutum TaxID=3635 RepID=A0ABM2YSC2_GOSHI|nr:paired amphipathic helix protein Sin3-like 2 [Gossypium hirsutum]
MKAECEEQNEMAGGGGDGAAEGGEGGGEGSTSREAAKNVAAAKRYLKEITETFEDRKEKLVKFREVMKDFKTNRTDVAGVVERVKELFEGHNNLLKGFNFFLPMGYEITVDKHQPPPKKMIGFLEPKDFMRLIKERDKHVYWSFVDVLLRYQREQRDIIKLYMEVDALFSKDYPDLFDDFKRYLPSTFL